MENELFAYISKYITLTEEEKKAISGLSLFRKYKKGTVFLKEGQLCNDVYFVIKGCIRCYYIIEGEEKTTSFYTESESFTPLCSINKEPSEYYASCVEDSILSVGSSEMEKEIFEKFPRFETVCRLVSEELQIKNQVAFDEFKISSPEQRYLSLLQKKPELVQRVPQYMMASYLGITPQSLSRIRSRLVKKPSKKTAAAKPFITLSERIKDLVSVTLQQN